MRVETDDLSYVVRRPVPSSPRPVDVELTRDAALDRMIVDASLLGLATLFADIELDLIEQASPTQALATLSRVAVSTIPGAENAGITQRRGTDRFTTLATTDDLVVQIDAIQYGLRSGPCVDAVLNSERVYHAEDLRTDERWPEFGRAAVARGVLSMLSFRLFTGTENTNAALNLYASTPEAFDETSLTIGLLMATHGGLALAASMSQEKVANLEKALESNREIGVAMGILIHRYQLTRQQAFDVLRITSQDTNRKLVAVAADVVDTGDIDLPPRLRSLA